MSVMAMLQQSRNGSLGVPSTVVRNKKIVFGAGLLVLLAGFVILAYRSFTHDFLRFTPQQAADIEIALKGSMGEAIFTGQLFEPGPATESKGKEGLDALFAAAPADHKSAGLIGEYRKDPQKFKHYAEMMDTAINAEHVYEALVRQDLLKVPPTSESLVLEAKFKVDAWGRPFCIIPTTERVGVVSGGPSHLSCDSLPVTTAQIAKSNRVLYAGPSDVVVFVATRSQRPRIN